MNDADASLFPLVAFYMMGQLLRFLWTLKGNKFLIESKGFDLSWFVPLDNLILLTIYLLLHR